MWHLFISWIILDLYVVARKKFRKGWFKMYQASFEFFIRSSKFQSTNNKTLVYRGIYCYVEGWLMLLLFALSIIVRSCLSSHLTDKTWDVSISKIFGPNESFIWRIRAGYKYGAKKYLWKIMPPVKEVPNCTFVFTKKWKCSCSCRISKLLENLYKKDWIF